MKYIKDIQTLLSEKKPAGAPDWHDSDAPDAEGRFKELSIKDLAAWLIKTRKKDLKKITGSLNQQIVFNRKDDPEYADKMEKTRKEVYKQLGREDLLKESEDKDYADDMAYGQLERCIDYSTMIRERIENGTELDPWMHSQIAVAENELNSVFDAIDGDDGVIEAKMMIDIKKVLTKIMGSVGFKHDPKMRQELMSKIEEVIKDVMSSHDYIVEADKKPGPDAYMTGLDDETEEEKEDQMKKQAEMDDDNPEAYKELPGDKEAREKGKVKTSKHVKSYHELYGDKEDKNESLVTEEKAKGDRGPIDNKSIETGLKNKSEETGVPIALLRIVMRRGLAAWKTGHRPGAGQEQWGYARVNSFLTKQPGTWGGADKDVAKEVRDGGHDKKLKKA